MESTVIVIPDEEVSEVSARSDVPPSVTSFPSIGRDTVNRMDQLATTNSSTRGTFSCRTPLTTSALTAEGATVVHAQAQGRAA
jgi:hypothetical protein